VRREQDGAKEIVGQRVLRDSGDRGKRRSGQWDREEMGEGQVGSGQWDREERAVGQEGNGQWGREAVGQRSETERQ
jgi:hypothetical protein